MSDDKITVVAQCRVTNEDSDELIVSFDRAWRRALGLKRPVSVSFTGFVRRKDK